MLAKINDTIKRVSSEGSKGAIVWINDLPGFNDDTISNDLRDYIRDEYLAEKLRAAGYKVGLQFNLMQINW